MLVFSRSFAGGIDGKTVSFDDFYKAMLSAEYTPIDTNSVGSVQAYYAQKKLIKIFIKKFNFFEPPMRPGTKGF